MCYLVTGVNPNSSAASARSFQIFDTEDEAKARAEQHLKSGMNEVAVWQQIAAPKIEQRVVWEEEKKDD
jgi:hypothetical protein